MAKYEKWLGAGLGWVVGGPLGGLLGFIAGNLIEKDTNPDTSSITKELTEFEVNLIVLSSHLIKVDGKISLAEVSFLNNFLNQHFNETPSASRTQIINHCMQKEYDLSAACDQIRINTPHQTRQQVVHFLFDLAMCDGDLTERENYFIFRLAGYLNINDVDFRRIKKEHNERPQTLFEILGVSSSASMSEIRTAYRRLVLKYHPDRNKNASEAERKRLAAKFQQIQEAYEKFKNENE